MITPLFYAGMDVLLEALRLGPSCNTSAQPIIAECILKARLRMYSELGEARVAELQALLESPNPVTAQERLRSAASLLELTMVRCCLQDKLPSVFLDYSGDIHQEWDEDALVREKSNQDRYEQRRTCSAEIKRLLDLLVDGTLDNKCGIYTYLSGPKSCDRRLLGDSMNPCFNPRRFTKD